MLSLCSRMHASVLNGFNVDDQESTWLVSTQICRSSHESLTSSKDVVVSNAIIVLKSLVQSQLHSTPIVPSLPSNSPLAIISGLAYRIEDIHHPQARACVLWLVGQYSLDPSRDDSITEWAPDVLRKSAKSFSQEVRPFKSPIIHILIGTLARRQW